MFRRYHAVGAPLVGMRCFFTDNDTYVTNGVLVLKRGKGGKMTTVPASRYIFDMATVQVTSLMSREQELVLHSKHLRDPKSAWVFEMAARIFGGHPALFLWVFAHCKALPASVGLDPRQADPTSKANTLTHEDETSIMKVANSSKAADALNALRSILVARKKDGIVTPSCTEPWTPDTGKLTDGVLYIPKNSNFPAARSFLLCDDVFVCFQTVTWDERELTADCVEQLMEYYKTMGVPSGAKRIIVYMQPEPGQLEDAGEEKMRIVSVQWPSDLDLLPDSGNAWREFWEGFCQYQYTVDEAFCDLAVLVSDSATPIKLPVFNDDGGDV